MQSKSHKNEGISEGCNQCFGAGAGRLRKPETPCRYIIARVNKSIYFFITLGTLLNSLFTNLLYFELWEPSQIRRLRNPSCY